MACNNISLPTILTDPAYVNGSPGATEGSSGGENQLCSHCDLAKLERTELFCQTQFLFRGKW